MKVLILGAGASTHSGYPRGSEVLNVLERHVADSHFGNLRTAWNGWATFRDSCPHELAQVVHNSNPEIVFTLPTLLQLAADSEDASRTTSAIAQATDANVQEHVTALEAYYDSDSRTFLSRAKIGLSHLMQAMSWYFVERHVADRFEADRRGPLRELLRELAPGDVVVTFNWDTTVERTLAELRLWGPATGYGFSKVLEVKGVGGKENFPLPPRSSQEIKVLKLHGSFGWYDRDGEVVFENRQYLDGFGFEQDGNPVTIVDPLHPEPGVLVDHLLLAPSLIKPLDHPALIQIWSEAHRALLAADVVEVWGYSLPEADAAARTLMLVVRQRLEAGSCQVVVHDEWPVTVGRWKRLLGEAIHVKAESLKAPAS